MPGVSFLLALTVAGAKSPIDMVSDQSDTEVVHTAVFSS